MFERDKEDLRDLGVPLVTGSNSGWDDEIGLIGSRAATMRCPSISLDPDEASALALAARLWSSASLAGARHQCAAQAAGAGRSPCRHHRTWNHGSDAREPGIRAAAGDAVSAGRVVQLQLPAAPGTGRAQPPGRRAVGRRVLARPLVSRRSRPRPRRHPRLPALSGRQARSRSIRSGSARWNRRRDVDLRAAVADSVPVNVVGHAPRCGSAADAAHGLRRGRRRPAPGRGVRTPGEDTAERARTADLGRLARTGPRGTAPTSSPWNRGSCASRSSRAAASWPRAEGA